MPIDDKTRKEFESWGQALPSSDSHGTEEDIRSNLRRLQPTGWYLRGNELVAETEWGPLVQRIPPNYICKGVDKEGLPILVKVEIKK